MINSRSFKLSLTTTTIKLLNQTIFSFISLINSYQSVISGTIPFNSNKILEGIYISHNLPNNSHLPILYIRQSFLLLYTWDSYKFWYFYQATHINCPTQRFKNSNYQNLFKKIRQRKVIINFMYFNLKKLLWQETWTNIQQTIFTIVHRDLNSDNILIKDGVF